MPIDSVLSAAVARAFAGATGDTAAVYGEAPGDWAPPMALVTASVPHGVQPLLHDPAVVADGRDLRQVLHLHESLRWLRPLRIAERLTVRAHLQRRYPGNLGETLEVATRIDCGDEPVARTCSTLVLRRRLAAADRPPPRRGRPVPVPTAPPQLLPPTVIDADQARRYAAASGDHNPIHLDPTMARQAGLRGCILHGLCSLTLMQVGLTRAFAGDDPRRLRALEVAFRRPVFMGDSLRCEAWPQATGVRFVARNGRGHIVLDGGHIAFADGN